MALGRPSSAFLRLRAAAARGGRGGGGVTSKIRQAFKRR